MTFESKDLSGICCPISSAAQCPKFDWAMSCQISGWTRALLKGGSCPHSFSISWWTALQPRSSLLLQESSCLGAFSVGSRISCTLMIRCLWLTHQWTFRPPWMPFTDGGVGSAPFGVDPTKSAVMVFGPRRRVPDCHLHLGGVSLPVVSPTLFWTKHVQLLISQGNRLLAQCVAWCRAEHLPVKMASSILRVCVLPSVSWGSEFFALSPAALHLLDGALARWRRHVLGWPPGAPCAGVLCELGWPDAEHLALGQLLSLLGRSSSMAQGLGCPLPTTHLPCVPILTSLLPLQLAFTHSRLLAVSVVGLIWLSPLL